MLAFLLKPHADESLNGYLQRLAAENFLSSANQFLRTQGLVLKLQYTPAELESLARLSQQDVALLQQMAEFRQVHGSLRSGYFLRRKGIAVCPACLAEAPYVRQAWHHELVTACPTHALQLLDECPQCARVIEPDRGSVLVCRCGQSLCQPDLAVEAAAADLWVSGILAGDERSVAAWRSALEWTGEVPEDVDQFVLFLANLKREQPQRRRKAMTFAQAREINQASYAIGNDLLRNFQAFVLACIERANQLLSSRFVLNLGPWYRALTRDFASPPYQALMNLVAVALVQHAQAPINRKIKYICAQQLALKNSYTAAEAARALGTSAERLFMLVKSQQLPGHILQSASTEYCVLDRLAVEQHREAALSVLHGRDLLKALNITRRIRDRLIESGVLQRVGDQERPLFARGEFWRRDVQQLLHVLETHYSPLPLKAALTLDEISGRRFSHEHANELYRAIFMGKIRPRERLAEVEGLLAYRFDESELQAWIPVEKALPEWTLTELSQASGWKHESIKSWIDGGYLKCHEPAVGGRKTRRVSLPQLIDFLSSHLVLADIARRMDSKSVWLSNALGHRGALAEGAHPTAQGTQRGLLVSTDRLMLLALGKAPAPAAVHCTEANVDVRHGGATPVPAYTSGAVTPC